MVSDRSLKRVANKGEWCTIYDKDGTPHRHRPIDAAEILAGKDGANFSTVPPGKPEPAPSPEKPKDESAVRRESKRLAAAETEK